MSTFFLVFFLFVAFMALMAIGVIFTGKPIKGSCGGLNTQGGCSLCGGQVEQCPSTPTNKTKA